MPNNKKKRSAKKREAKAEAKANEEANNHQARLSVKQRVEDIYARCTVEIAEDLEERFQSTWPPTQPLEQLSFLKQYPKAYANVSDTFNAGMDLIQKGTGITGLSRWHLVLDKMLDALDIITKKGNETTQSLFLERKGGDHRQLLCSITVTITQTMQKASLFDRLKAWAKVAIAADPTYFRGYAYLATGVIYHDYDWKLARDICKKAYEAGMARGAGKELTPAINRLRTMEEILNAPKDKARKLKRDYIADNRGTAIRMWQDMNIPRPTRTCNLCYAVGERKCSKCKTVYYCQRGCQILDYQEHKLSCIEPAKENLLEIIETPNFSEDELMADGTHWFMMKQSAEMMGISMMMAACNNCHLKAVKRAIMEGGDVNEKCSMTLERPIMLAALRREPDAAVEIVRTLILHGACPNVMREDGEHLLSICRGRAGWIDDHDPSGGNSMFKMEVMMKNLQQSLRGEGEGEGESVDPCEREERRESAELVQLVTSAIQQHKLCKLCKARKKLRGSDSHLRAGNLTDEFLEYEMTI